MSAAVSDGIKMLCCVSLLHAADGIIFSFRCDMSDMALFEFRQ
jgi:hypothetical protein